MYGLSNVHSLRDMAHPLAVCTTEGYNESLIRIAMSSAGKGELLYL
jgi:hypothetical protein